MLSKAFWYILLSQKFDRSKQGSSRTNLTSDTTLDHSQKTFWVMKSTFSHLRLCEVNIYDKRVPPVMTQMLESPVDDMPNELIDNIGLKIPTEDFSVFWAFQEINRPTYPPKIATSEKEW